MTLSSKTDPGLLGFNPTFVGRDESTHLLTYLFALRQFNLCVYGRLV